jgi:hypothetical protein
MAGVLSMHGRHEKRRQNCSSKFIRKETHRRHKGRWEGNFEIHHRRRLSRIRSLCLFGYNIYFPETYESI